MARNHQDALLAQARVATNSLTSLLATARQLASDAEALRTNETGRQVALHADLVAQARHLYDVELPALTPLAELTTKLESIRRIQQTVLENLGKAYEPEAEFTVTAQNAALWAEPELRKIAQAQSAVAALGREAAVKVTSATVTVESPTLAAAIRQLTEAEAKERQRVLAAQTAAANTNAMLMEAQAQVQRILQQALAQSNQVVLELQAQAAVRQASNQVAQAATEAEVKAAEERARQIQREAVAQSNMMYAAFQGLSGLQPLGPPTPDHATARPVSIATPSDQWCEKRAQSRALTGAPCSLGFAPGRFGERSVRVRAPATAPHYESSTLRAGHGPL